MFGKDYRKINIEKAIYQDWMYDQAVWRFNQENVKLIDKGDYYKMMIWTTEKKILDFFNDIERILFVCS